MRTVALIVVLAGFVAAYILVVRPYLKTLPQFMQLYAREESLWGALRIWLDGRKTIMVGIWGEVVAMAPDVLQQAQVFDLKTLLGLPDHWAMYVNALIPVLMMIFRAKAR